MFPEARGCFQGQRWAYSHLVAMETEALSCSLQSDLAEPWVPSLLFKVISPAHISLKEHYQRSQGPSSHADRRGQERVSLEASEWWAGLWKPQMSPTISWDTDFLWRNEGLQRGSPAGSDSSLGEGCLRHLLPFRFLYSDTWDSGSQVSGGQQQGVCAPDHPLPRCADGSDHRWHMCRRKHRCRRKNRRSWASAVLNLGPILHLICFIILTKTSLTLIIELGHIRISQWYSSDITHTTLKKIGSKATSFGKQCLPCPSRRRTKCFSIHVKGCAKSCSEKSYVIFFNPIFF